MVTLPMCFDSGNRTREASQMHGPLQNSLSHSSPYPDGRAARIAAREGSLTGNTAGVALGYVQGNLVVLPASLAADFLRFAQRNPKPCPLIGVSEPGVRAIPELGEDLDIATDIPQYRV